MTNVAPFPRAASTKRLAQFKIGERLFLWGFRTMAQHHRCGRPAMVAMHQVYAQFHVEDAVASLDALIEAFACTAHSAIEIHSPCCPCVSESEFFLLQAVAAAQSGALDVSWRSLERWLPDLAVDWALGPLRGIGKVFEAAGLKLPLRDAGTTTTEKTSATRRWPVRPQALH